MASIDRKRSKKEEEEEEEERKVGKSVEKVIIVKNFK